MLLDDPDLAAGLNGSRLRMAQRDLLAPAVLIEGRRWAPDEDAAAARGGIGLLLLEGMIVRRVGREGRFGAELLGPGDLLRPWQHDSEDSTLPFDTAFRIVEPTQMAVLDLRFAARLAPYPEVIGNLVGRAMQRSRTLAVNMAIAHHTRVDRRLLMLFWHLADRWGRVTPEGIRVPLSVTHQVLRKRLVAARRAAERALRRRALVDRSGGPRRGLVEDPVRGADDEARRRPDAPAGSVLRRPRRGRERRRRTNPGDARAAGPRRGRRRR